MTKQEKDHLKNLVANNKIEQVTEKLLQYALDDNDRNEVTALQARYNHLEQQIRLGTLSTEDQNLQRSRINNSLLKLIDQIIGTKNTGEINTNESNVSNKNRWIVILGALGSLASIVSLMYIFNPKPDVKQLTVFVTNAKGNAVLEYQGELNIPMGNRILNSPIERKGRTNFADITSDNIGDLITIGLKAEGWEIDGSNKFKYDGEPITLIVKRDNSLATIKGIVLTRDGTGYIDSARITINADTTIYSNDAGLFEIILPENMSVESDKERYRLRVSKDGYEPADEYYQVKSSNAEIRLTKIE